MRGFLKRMGELGAGLRVGLGLGHGRIVSGPAAQTEAAIARKFCS